jgi:hypothetical protein
MIRVTSEIKFVDCELCLDTPEFEVAQLLADRRPDGFVQLTYDRLLRLEPQHHRTLDQILAWGNETERAEVAVWAGRCHLRARFVVPPRPDVMSIDDNKL